MVRNKLTIVTAVVLALSFSVFVGCGDDDEAETTTTQAAETTAATTTTEAGPDDLLAEVLDRGTIVISTEAKYPPWAYYDDDGNIAGFEIDVAEEIARRLGVETEYVEPDFSVVAAGNWAGRWDMSVQSLTVTEERQDVLLFTQAYTGNPVVFALHEDNTDIVDLETDLDGKRIGCCAGCVQQRYLEKDIAIEGFDVNFVVDDAEVVPYEGGSEAAYADLILGDGVRLDAVLGTIAGVCGQIEAGAPLKPFGYEDPVLYEWNSIAFDKNAPKDPTRLWQEVDRILGEMMEEGFVAEASVRHFEEDISAGREIGGC